MTKSVGNGSLRTASSKRGPAPDWAISQNPVDTSAERNHAFRKAILAIPPGKVSTYGGVAAAAGFPRHHRAVARLLHQDNWDELPWHRVVGADREIKTSGASAKEQRARLRMEGVKFTGNKVERSALLRPPI